jgi:hypothetical protein
MAIERMSRKGERNRDVQHLAVMFENLWRTLLGVVLFLKDGESGSTLFEIHISIHHLLCWVLVHG